MPLIRHAHKSELWVAAASWRRHDPGMQSAHEAWVVDTADRERLLELAREKRIDPVTTTGTDVAVPSIGYICDQLGFPGVIHPGKRKAHFYQLPAKPRVLAQGDILAPVDLATTRIGDPI